ncbi:glycoside hydrolase, family 3-like protein [Candidatus Koribacter versatilis Ellin345]|uniref:beta-N-acetylhexosaminidase n=1 Tax=Koribacter versatilis (strain Ellin345) TaxID=204669 RepID=Q1IHT6_KORVE|nr:glycoside hydrolase, family 3-like protein [Candidatus Koribacter versatilis Ellin345]
MIRRILALLLTLTTLFPSAFAKDRFQQPGPVHLDKDGEKWADKTLKSMSLEEKVGQMFMIWSKAQFVNVQSPDFLKLRDTMARYHLGGFGVTVNFEDGFLFKTEPYEAAMMINELQQGSEIPLIIAADFERGLSMRLKEATDFPHAMAFGATNNPAYAKEFGRITALESRAIGVEWNWFPDADVNSNPANPIINTRSFGEDPQAVASMVKAYIEGAHAEGLLTTVKHFPGHGDTDTDTHLATARINQPLEHIQNVELVPFKAAIDAGVDSVMIGHLVVPALDPDTNRVATISPKIVNGTLKKDLGFQGLVVTDAMEMNGLAKLFGFGPEGSARAAVAAVKAGDDMLLLPSDLDGAYEGLIKAVKRGEIPESRIDESVRKILRMKASVGLNKAKLVDVEQMKNLIARPDSLSVAQEIADSAVTLVRSNDKTLPLRAKTVGTSGPHATYEKPEGVRGRQLAVIITDDSRSESGRIFDQQIRRRSPEMRTIWVDDRNAVGMSDTVLQAVREAEKVVVAIYAIPSAGRVKVENGQFKASSDMSDAPAALVKNILRVAGSRTVVVAMGNPYLAQDFPEVQNYMCTYSNAQVSDVAAVKALFGDIAIRGHLPVTIPQFAERGAGIQLPAK